MRIGNINQEMREVMTEEVGIHHVMIIAHRGIKSTITTPSPNILALPADTEIDIFL